MAWKPFSVGSGSMLAADVVQNRQLRHMRDIAIYDAEKKIREGETDALLDKLKLAGILTDNVKGDSSLPFQLNKEVLADGRYNSLMLEFLQRGLGDVLEYRVEDENGKTVGWEKMDISEGNGEFISREIDGEMKYLVGGVNPEKKRIFWTKKNRKKGSSADAKKTGDIPNIGGAQIDMMLELSLLNLLGDLPEDEREDATAAALESNLMGSLGREQIEDWYAKNTNLGDRARTKQRNMMLGNIRRVQNIAKEAGNDKLKFLNLIQRLSKDPKLKGTEAFFQMLEDGESLWLAIGGKSVEPRGDNVPTTAVTEEGLSPQPEDLSPQPEDTVDDRGPGFRFTEEELFKPEEEAIPEGASIYGTGSTGGAPINTGRTTTYMRPIWEDPTTGEEYSERTVTFQLSNGRWINMPSIDENGMPIPQQELERYAEAAVQNNLDSVIRDPISGESILTYENVEIAENMAQRRSDSMSNDFITRAEAANKLGNKEQAVEIMRNWFSDKNVKDLEGIAQTIKETVGPYDVQRAMRLTAGLTDDPDEALKRLDNAMGTSYFKEKTGKGFEPSETYGEYYELASKLLGARPTAAGFEYLTGDVDDGKRGSRFKGRQVKGYVSPSEARTIIRTLSDEIRRLDPNGNNAQFAPGRDLVQQLIIDTNLGQMVIDSEQPLRKRVLPWGWFGREQIFGSDAMLDNISPYLGGRPNFRGDTINPQTDNIRLLVGEGPPEEGGADIEGVLGSSNLPRIAVFQNGQETTASRELGHILHGDFSGNATMGLKAFKSILSPGDYNKLLRWMESEQYKEYRKQLGQLNQAVKEVDPSQMAMDEDLPFTAMALKTVN